MPGLTTPRPALLTGSQELCCSGSKAALDCAMVCRRMVQVQGPPWALPKRVDSEFDPLPLTSRSRQPPSWTRSVLLTCWASHANTHARRVLLHVG